MTEYHIVFLLFILLSTSCLNLAVALTQYCFQRCDASGTYTCDMRYCHILQAAILHQASDYITTLESEKNQLLTQNSFLRKRLKEIAPHEYSTISPPPKRKKRDTDSSDEGISMNFDDGSEELRKLLQREKQQREYFEEKTKRLEAQLVPERLHALASQVSREPMATDDMVRY